MSAHQSRHHHTASHHASPSLTTVAAGVPLLDLARQNGPLHAELSSAIERVCESGRFILGPECEQLEQQLADYCQVPSAVACASGSDALLWR